MKKNILFCFLVFSTLLFAQGRTITGTIKDKNTQKPIDGVSVSIIGSNIGTVSNDDGKFKITIPEENSKLRFYHLSYSDKNYEVTANVNMEILMIPREYLLNEVVINRKPSPELLNNVFKTSIEKLQKNHLLNTYYREFMKVDDKYVWFADGLLDYFIIPKKDNNFFNSELGVKQSRDSYFKDPNLIIDDRELQSLKINDIQNAVFYAYTSGAYLSSDFFSFIDDYDYRVETKNEAEGQSVGVITIIPKEGMQKDQMMVISITYDMKTRLILEVDIKQSPEHKKYNTMHEMPSGIYKANEKATKVSFRIDGDKYVMTHYQKRMNLYVSGNGKYGGHTDNTIEFLTDLTTLNYKEADFKVKKYKKNNLLQNGNKYTEEFWKNQNIRLLSDEEEKIINDLNQKSSSRVKSTIE